MPPGKLSRAYSKSVQVGIAPGQAGAPGLMGFGQGALGFHPTDLPNVVFGWTTESLGVKADGTQIALIQPVVSNNVRPLLQATPSARPTYLNNARNGYPALMFDPAFSQNIQQATNDQTQAMGYSSKYFSEVVVFMNNSSAATTRIPFGLLTGTDAHIMLQSGDGVNLFYTLGTPGAGAVSSSGLTYAADLNKWHIIGAQASAGGVNDVCLLRLDGTQFSSNTFLTYLDPNSQPWLVNGFTAGVGCRGGGNFWSGAVAEGWVFNGQLSLPDWKRLEQYFSRKYNITVAG